ncbi:Mucin-associated surface protein (MASP) subgroup S018 [Trypanosoma cruzi]|uniref:Mucin-associated surface protein (MASP) subgroup S018 n=1 Tax=Trypanosoma cruzi TaxID=5693 RepID=A0A7J6XTN6_TRYCR|nr:Mucin-associated surface protein (MASP) subgroup S018 [Trypanosoma cruzi]
MAMMAGRVLLVCALCVLWCGAGGRCDEEGTAARGSGGGPPLASKQPETPRVGSEGVKNGVTVAKENVIPTPPLPIDGDAEVDEDEDDDDDDNDNDADGDEEDNETGESKEKSTEGQINKEGKVPPDSDFREKNLVGSRQEKGQSIVPAGDISHSKSQESNANSTQTEVEGKKDADKRPPSAENALTTVNGENTLPEGIAGGNPPSPPEDSVASREKDGEDTTSEDEKNVPSPESAATPQSHRDEVSEGTGEDTKATTVTTNTTDTTNKQNSDGSTAAATVVQPEDGVESNPANNDLSPPSTEVAAQLSMTPDAEGASNNEENTDTQIAGNPNVTIATATQTNDTAKPTDSDGSTVASHTTSPLLLLLFVACAAAAAVVAA